MEVRRWQLYQYIRDISDKDKKIIIFGSDARAVKLYHKLSLMDLKVSYFVDDIVKERMLCESEVRNYNDLLYEDFDKIKIIVMEPADLEKLFKIGICSRYEMENCCTLFAYSSLSGTYPLDPMIGYNIFGDTEFPGFVVFGNREADYTIVTLGGSTTDALYAAYGINKKIKSWSEILANKLEAEGISVRILCGGVAEYKSSQELLKLIRDVVPFNPDMVVTYNGFNEFSFGIPWNDGFSFLNRHQKKLFSLACQIKKEGMLADECTFGINSKWDAYGNWKNSVKMMDMICREYGIEYISVLQPSFYNQVEMLGEKSDREIFMHVGLSNENLKEVKEFFEEKDKDKWKPEYLKDLRNVFQGIDDVFFDTCHVWEKGNEIIADRILEFVKETLFF